MTKMQTIIKTNKDYKVIERKVVNEKPIPNKVLDLIIPIIKEAIKWIVSMSLYTTNTQRIEGI